MDNSHRELKILGSIRIWYMLLAIYFLCAFRSSTLSLGSWEGSIRLWKLNPQLKSFSLVGTIPAPGVTNSLQLLAVPGEALATALWTAESEKPAERKNRGAKVTSVLLVAGMGQEHRLGRWMKIKENGAVNGTIVIALHPRTSD